MFHWICPECGREIPPSVRECRACDPAAVAAELPKALPSRSIAETHEPVVTGNLPLAETVAAPGNPAAESTPVLETAPVPDPPTPSAEAATAPPVKTLTAAVPPPVETIASSAATPFPGNPDVVESPVVAGPPPVAEQVAPLVELAGPVAPLAVVPPPPVAENLPIMVPEPVAAQAAPVALEPLAGVAPPPVPAPEPAKKEEPPPASQIEVPDPLLALAEEIRAAQEARAQALAEAPASQGLVELAGVIAEHQSAPAPAEPVAVPETRHAAEPQLAIAPAPGALALLAPPETQTIPPLVEEPVGFHELRPAALAPDPRASAQPEPVALAEPQAQPVALAQEPEGPTLPFAPMQEYTPATRGSIQPVPPRAQILSADSGPRITLPGPTLPPELTRLKDANVVTVIGEDTVQRTKEAIPPASQNTGAPGWLVSGFVMVLLLAVGLGIVFYLLPHTVADAKPTPAPAAAATIPAPTGSSSPLAKYIEVTGFRIVTSKADAAKKSEVQYLIVNHSDADISDVNVFVTLRGVKPGQAPVCRFSFKVPSLGPFESKEMSSPIENAARAVSLPGWQELRADVQISQ